MPGLATEDVAWFGIEHASSVGAVRRALVDLALRLGLGEVRANEAGIAVGEVAANQLAHAERGSILLQCQRTPLPPRVTFVAIDSGPGIGDVDFAMADGNSSGGTLGIGLGAVARLASWCDLYSAPGDGTVLAASFAAGPMAQAPTTHWAAGLTRPMSGQEVCGDGFAIRQDGTALTVLLVDGLGHGPLAERAAAAARRGFLDAPFASPAPLLTAVDRAARGTRGVAGAIAQTNGDGVLCFAGAGNIGGFVLDGERPKGLTSYPGIVGVNLRAARETRYDLASGVPVVLASDGLTPKLTTKGRPRLLARSPLVVAATLLRDFGTRNDDASVVVIAPVRQP